MDCGDYIVGRDNWIINSKKKIQRSFTTKS